MKWMVAMCALVMTGGFAQAEVASGDSTAGGTASSEQQPPSDLLPRVDELPAQPAVARDRIGVAWPAHAGRVYRYHRSRGRAAFSSRRALHRRHHFAGGHRGGRYARRARFERAGFAHHRYHQHQAWSHRSLAHRHRHRRHLVFSPYGPYMAPAAFYGPPVPYYGPAYADPF
jgi:hypothetical protein